MILVALVLDSISRGNEFKAEVKKFFSLAWLGFEDFFDRKAFLMKNS